MNKTKLFAAAVLTCSLVACGDNASTPDAPTVKKDSGGPPAVPALGAQIDRMGRPAISTALNHAFDVTAATKNAAKDAYNADGGTGSWQTTYTAEFAKNLAIIDSLDTGIPGGGCGNQVLYNNMPAGGGTAGSASYKALAGILADDQLYLDTTKTMCTKYLAVEFGVVTGMGNTLCGGRAPSYDVMDYSYSVLALGLAGFDASLNPKFGDNVAAHSDISDTAFPFLGAPH
jgi:hypothetical protein